MTESYDYKPAPQWGGHDFGAARKAYDRHVGSSYADAKAKGVDYGALIEETLSTTAKRPLIIVVDQTGSMGDWPATMFSKLPYLEHEANWYLGDDAEIAFAAIGDANNNEKYPLQVRPFAKGPDLAAKLKELVIEGNGGGQLHETYELAALYLLHHLEVEPDAEPIVIFIGDEHFYDTISADLAKRYCRVDLNGPTSGREVFSLLQTKASVYLIQKPYRVGRGDMDEQTLAVHQKWASALGEDHIAVLPDPNRVVDVIFGILAQETNRAADFEEEIRGRQKPAQVDLVMKSLETIHVIGTGRKALPKGVSTLLVDDDGASSSSLLS